MATQPNGTGVVDINSELVRKGWIMKGLVQARSTSFWDGMTGTSEDSVIYQKNNFAASDGHQVIFQMDGNLVSEAHVDREQAWGNSEQKKLFSDRISVRRLRWSVDNGDKFDAKNIGDLSLAEHSDSRTKLSDLFIRAKDQMIFDTIQGRMNNEGPSHILRPNNKQNIAALTSTDAMGYDFHMQMERAIKSGRGYTHGGKRRPLEPYKLSDGRKVWLVLIDSIQSSQLRLDDKFINITTQGDVRGSDNRLIKGIVGSYGPFIYIEAQNFFGVSSSRLIGKTKVEISGLREVDEDGNFTGETGFGTSGKIVASRGVILGKGAVQIAFGKMPDYKVKSSQDFDIKTESALEVWMNAQKTILNTEGTDYDDAKVAGFDYGMVCFETYSSTVA